MASISARQLTLGNTCPVCVVIDSISVETLELSFGENELLNRGDLVKCLDTDKVGSVIDILHFKDRSMVMVGWPNETSWVDIMNLSKLDSF